MSFSRHEEIYHCEEGDGGEGAIPQDHALAHRNDECPAGHSSAACSPAVPASASPATAIIVGGTLNAKIFTANGKLSPISLSQLRGAVPFLTPFPPGWRRHLLLGVCDFPKGPVSAHREQDYTLGPHAFLQAHLQSGANAIHHQQHLSGDCTLLGPTFLLLFCPKARRSPPGVAFPPHGRSCRLLPLRRHTSDLGLRMVLLLTRHWSPDTALHSLREIADRQRQRSAPARA